MTLPTARVLTIAGSDPSGGAGLQADLRTFAALGVWGTSAVTAITVQDGRRVSRVEPLEAGLVAAQVEAALSDPGADAVKTGMLATGAIVEAVASVLRAARSTRLVVDPVLAATSGTPLLDAEGRGRLLDPFRRPDPQQHDR